MRFRNYIGNLVPASNLAALAILAAAGSSAASDRAPSAPLKVHLSHLRSDKGRTGCTLYDGPRGFPSDAAAAKQRRWCAIRNGNSDCEFSPIEKGTYAVACFHDENGNGKLDTGLFGIPSEGTVVSNEAKGRFGPPKWEAAKFAFAGIPSQLTLRMSY